MDLGYLLRGSIPGQQQAENPHLAQPASDQLGVLAPKVQDNYGLVLSQGLTP
jgi:hypothetical protein